VRNQVQCVGYCNRSSRYSGALAPTEEAKDRFNGACSSARPPQLPRHRTGGEMLAVMDQRDVPEIVRGVYSHSP
jgi:hypothetical protein